MVRYLLAITVALSALSPAAAGQQPEDLAKILEPYRGNASSIAAAARSYPDYDTIRRLSLRLESDDPVVSSEARQELLDLGSKVAPVCFAVGLLGPDLDVHDANVSGVYSIPSMGRVAAELLDNMSGPDLVSALGRLRNTQLDLLILRHLTSKRENPEVTSLLADAFANGSLIFRNRICLDLPEKYARHFIVELIAMAAHGEIDDPQFIYGAGGRGDLQPFATDLMLRVADANVPALIEGTMRNSSYARGRCAAAMKYVRSTHAIIPSLAELLSDGEPGGFGAMGRPIPVGRLAAESLTRLTGIPDPRLQPPLITGRNIRENPEEIINHNPLLVKASAAICAGRWKLWYKAHADVLGYDRQSMQFRVPQGLIHPGAFNEPEKSVLRQTALRLLTSEDRLQIAKGLLFLNSSGIVDDVDTLRYIAAGADIALAAIALEIIWNIVGKDNTAIYFDIILNANEAWSAGAVHFYLSRIGLLPSEAIEQILKVGKVPARVRVLALVAGSGKYKGLLPRVRESLQDENAEVRAKACEVFVATPYKDARPQLLSLLEDASPDVRGAAALALAECEDRMGIFSSITEHLELESSPAAFFGMVDALISIDNAAAAKFLVALRRKPDYPKKLDEELRLRLLKLSGVDLFADDITQVFEGSTEEALWAARYMVIYAPKRVQPKVREMLVSRREGTVRAGIFLAAELRMRNLTPQVWSLVGAGGGKLTAVICEFAAKAGGYDLVPKLFSGIADGSLPKWEALIALDSILGFNWAGRGDLLDERALRRRFERWWENNSGENIDEIRKKIPSWFKQGCDARLALFTSENEKERRGAARQWRTFWERHTGLKARISDNAEEKVVRKLWDNWWDKQRGQLKFNPKRRLLLKEKK
ncbi:MAG: HEAT repeat domain-containing protein [Planctomycetota bacterium]|nr:MAG: HEAT repeat domain-containing protein [Planctomycetota bacterium]